MKEPQNLFLKINILLFVLLHLTTMSLGQVRHFDLNILQDTIFGSNPKIEIELSNSSKEDFIFVGLNEFGPGVTTQESYCDGNNTCGLDILIFNNKNHSQVWPAISDTCNINEVYNIDSLHKILSRTQAELLDTRKIINAKSNFSDALVANLASFGLKRGYYRLKIVYYSGRNLNNLIAPSDINKIELNDNAKLFKGCLISNEVLLVIR